jgi:hypothetical protein
MPAAGTHLPLAPRAPKAPPEPEQVTNDKPSKLVHLARTPSQAKAAEGMVASSPGDASAYGYGLGLELGPDETQKLGMTAPPAPGSTVHATVKMHVTSARSEPTVGGTPRQHVGLTVTHMQIHPPGEHPPKVTGKVVRVKTATPKVQSTVPRKVNVTAHLRRAPKPKMTVKPPRPPHVASVKPPTVRRVK